MDKKTVRERLQRMESIEDPKIKLTKEEVESFFEKLQKNLTLDGKTRVFTDGQELSSKHMKEPADPEAITKDCLIEPLISKLKLEKLPEKHFKGLKNDLRKVDYCLKNQKGVCFLMEAKSLNHDLYDKSPDGAVNQIKGLFRLVEVKEKYKFGVATDGKTYVFIDSQAIVAFQLDVKTDFDEIFELLIGKEEVSSEKIEEEISKKFYDWYNALLHGGSYKDHENKSRKISEKDCLVENIWSVTNKDSREEISQTILDRLIFIKFLQSKGVVENKVLDYLSHLDESVLNDKLKQLFFSVLNTREKERSDVDSNFKKVPYLNGSLFVRTKSELENPDYKIRSFILKEVIKFLDSFRFIHHETAKTETLLDPQVLGYIFEKAMTAEDRKGTGAYYTPRDITRYISENTIYPSLVGRVNKMLKEKGYKEGEMLKNIKEIYNLRESNLIEIFEKILPSFSVCDNACGSGAFLLAGADALFEIYKRINSELRMNNTEITIKKLILKNNLYGVDINPNAVEIAKLRLWLWLVNSYSPEKIEPLPNIDYNIRVGNSLIGYTDIKNFRENKITLTDWYSPEKSLVSFFKRRDEAVRKYKDTIGEEAKKIKKEIEEIDLKIKKLLDVNAYQSAGIQEDLKNQDFIKAKPLHWGFEFYELFNKNDEDKGFDVIIGNPPYGNLLNDLEKKLINHYKTKNASEISANFIELSLATIKKGGCIGFIIANSLAINKSTSSARKLIRESMSESKMALFGTRPAKIFADAEIRVLIFTGKVDKPEKPGIIFTTEAIKFNKEERDLILKNLSFESTDGLTLGERKIGDEKEDVSLPKVGNLTIRNILTKLKHKSDIVFGDRINQKGFNETMELRKTAGYWLNALEKMPYTSTKIEKINFQNSIERDFCILVINSSLFYLYWSTYGNLRDFPPSLLYKFPIPALEVLNKNKTKIVPLKDKLSRCLLGSFIADRGQVGEFKTAKCKPFIDEVDDFLAEIYGLDSEERDYVKGYDSHIRKLQSE